MTRPEFQSSVLVVDDDDLVRMSLELEAVDAGFRVACAACGREALELARLNHFDVVVCDIRMPGMDGLEVIEQIKRLQPYAGTIVITAYASPDTPVRALKLQVDDYLLKPFDGPTFLDSMRAVLQRQRALHPEGPHSPAHQEALLGILRTTAERLPRTDLAEFAAVRASGMGLSPRRVRLVYLCGLLYDVDLSFLAPFSGLRAVATILREARQAVSDSHPEARLLSEAVQDYEGGKSAEPFCLPEADWIGVENLMRLAQKHRALGKWAVAEALYKKILEPPDTDEETILKVQLEQFLLSLERGSPLVALGRSVRTRAEKLEIEPLLARATLHLGRVSEVEPEALYVARRYFEFRDDSVRVTACDLLLQAKGDVEAAARAASSEYAEQARQLLPELTSSEERCRIRMFGPFRVFFKGKPMPDSDWVSRKDRLLVAYLCAHAGKVLAEDLLLELLWEQGGDKARHSLHNSVSQSRKVLSRLCGLKGRDLIERVGDGYRIGSPIEVDLSLFRDAFESGQGESLKGKWQNALSHLMKAESLALGEVMEGDYQEWTFPLREEVTQKRVELLSMLARYHTEALSKDKAELYWKKVLDLDNCREEAYAALLGLLAEDGRESEALRLLKQAETSFEQELGLPLPHSITRAYQTGRRPD